MSEQFVAARWYTATKGRVIDLVVLHSMEAPEKGDTAENVARYFQRLNNPASAHFCVDNDSVVQCVKVRDVAYAAPGANHNGVHIEMAGYARQTRADWQDPYSHGVIRQAAQLTARLCADHGVPIRPRGFMDLRAGGSALRGITTHNEVSKAWHKTDHTDPGIGFPMDTFIALVHGASREIRTQERVAMAEAFQKYPNAIDACMIPGWNAPDGRPGVWVLGSDGGVFACPEGVNVPFHGSMGGKPLNAPMCKIIAPGTSTGYYMIGEDGGIFAFGSAVPLTPYKPFAAEFKAGVHRIVSAEYLGSCIVLLSSDGAAYRFEIPHP